MELLAQRRRRRRRRPSTLCAAEDADMQERHTFPLCQQDEKQHVKKKSENPSFMIHWTYSFLVQESQGGRCPLGGAKTQLGGCFVQLKQPPLLHRRAEQSLLGRSPGRGALVADRPPAAMLPGLFAPPPP